jgi:hypothetical protein|tara:strand:+ start:47686 stop:47886 length:201 start_codon:yes stop_codon:yes gene_type:complete
MKAKEKNKKLSYWVTWLLWLVLMTVWNYFWQDATWFEDCLAAVCLLRWQTLLHKLCGWQYEKDKTQ